MIEIVEKRVMAPFTSWKIGGPADFFCLPRTVADVVEAMKWADERKLAITVLGAGSNVLISDDGIEGLVICNKLLVGSTASEVIIGDVNHLRIEALAGTPKSELLKIFLRYKLLPALFLCGLPGDVAGGVVMNAGVSENYLPREFSEIVEGIEVARLNGADVEIVKLSGSALRWEYRRSEGWQPGVIVRVTISWPLSPEPSVLEKVKQATRGRLLKQPLDMPSCGSVFKNPGAAKAGALIEQAGLKGYTYGGAQISAKHANFIVNLGHATAGEVDHVIKLAQATVLDKFGISIQPEVRYLGRW